MGSGSCSNSAILAFFNSNARKNRCKWDNNKSNKIYHQHAGSFVITRRFKKGFYRYMSSEREAKENVGSVENKLWGCNDKGHGKGQGSWWLLHRGLCWHGLFSPSLCRAVGSGATKHHPRCRRQSWRPLKQVRRFQVYGTTWDLSVGANMTAKLLSPGARGEGLMTGRRQILYMSSQRARRKIWGPWSPKRLRGKPSWICCVHVHQGQDDLEQTSQI